MNISACSNFFQAFLFFQRVKDQIPLFLKQLVSFKSDVFELVVASFVIKQQLGSGFAKPFQNLNLCW
jgi:hypothetical protein